ncbi:pitrilysin family protein [Thalassospiraceae bacterium LMO-JJ14]|nr:pitrilysin family protein [Thalassospiraceae bacterium LMO-JJ14]
MKRIFTRFSALIATACVVVLLASAPARAVEVERVVSAGGIEAWLIRDPSNPITTMKLSFRGGTALDPDGKGGLANFVASTLDEGAGDMDSAAFQEALDERSISLRFSAGRDTFRGSLKTLNKYRDDAFEYLRLALNEPRFDAEPLTRMRAQILSGIKQQNEDPGNLASRAIFETAFEGHPYARDNDGTAESVSAITPEDMRRFVRQRLAKNNLLIGVVGDIDAETLKGYLDRAFGSLPEKASPWQVEKITPKLSGSVKVIDVDVPQSSIQFAQPGILRNDPDFYTAYVLNYVIGGGGFVSRLYEEVREKRGLAYSVYTYLMPLDAAGAVMGGAGTANARVAETVATVREVWKRFAAEGPTAAELKDAKTYLTGAFPMRFTSSSAIAGMLVGMQEEGLGIDYIDKRNGYIEAVTLEDARRVAQRLYQPDKLTFAIAGKPEGISSVN